MATLPSTIPAAMIDGCTCENASAVTPAEVSMMRSGYVGFLRDQKRISPVRFERFATWRVMGAGVVGTSWGERRHAGKWGESGTMMCYCQEEGFVTREVFLIRNSAILRSVPVSRGWCPNTQHLGKRGQVPVHKKLQLLRTSL